MTYPKKVKFIGNKKDNPLYESGLRKNKIYCTIIDAEEVLEIYKESGVVTVLDDSEQGHEIEFGDYVVIE